MKYLHPRWSIRSTAKWMVALFWVVIILLSISIPGYSQDTNTIEISKPETSSFPDLSVYFRVIDGSGSFDKQLDLNSVHILEDGQVISPETLELQEPGLHLVFAVNEGPTLANRYAQVARIDKVKTALTEWAGSKTLTTMDDFSLVTNSGILATSLDQPSDWVKTLDNYLPDLRAAKPGVASLSTAVDLAAQKNGINKTAAVLYFTSLPSEDQFAGIEDAFSRAKLAGVRLFIILAGPQTYDTDENAAILIRAANETDGNFLIFSGPEEPPNLGKWFDPLTYVYKASYVSKINAGINHRLVLRINRGQSAQESDPVSFTLNVLPPNPIFLSPPAQVERTWTETKRIRDSVLTPDSIPLEIMIEFPDGLDRDLIYSRLFVDGKMVAENTSPPFDQFAWNIDSFTTSAVHKISATIEDQVGFIVETVELPVEVVIQPKPQNWMQKLFSAFNAATILLFLVIASAGILLVSLAIRTMRINRASKIKRIRKLEDPLTQPVQIENEIIHPKPKSSLNEEWPHLPGMGLAPARLVLQSTSQDTITNMAEIPISLGRTTFGNDPKKASVVLPLPLISSLHARIVRDDQDIFKIYDEGSASGTWLNYAPVSQYGARLEHGDLVQFGTVAYRFEIYGSQTGTIKVERLKDLE